MLRSVLLFISVFGTDVGTCAPASLAFVPMPGCAPDPVSGFANVDMDALTNPLVQINFTNKSEHTDYNRTVHPATDGTFTYQSENGRFVLDKAQQKDLKTIQITVTRPASILEFGGEWVKMYEKDSWTNITNEYEPFTFNDYGSKISLFRYTTENDNGQILEDDANATGELNVYMEMSADGDYEIRYGNPKLYTTTGKWIALEFKDHQLRVGNPFGSASTKYDGLGTIVPVYLGNPALLKQEYLDVAATMTTAIATAGHTKKVATKVILPIFTPANKGADGLSTWTEGFADEASQNEASHCDKDGICTDMKYKGCYSSGRACPLDHSVCSIDNCELQRWREIMDKFHENTDIEVIGLIETKNEDGSPRTKAEMQADIDDYTNYMSATKGVTDIKGFYFNEAHGNKSVVTEILEVNALLTSKFTVFGLGEPLFETDFVKDAGAPDVWVTLNNNITELGVWTPYSWFSSVDGYSWSSSNWAAIVDTVPSGVVTDTIDSLVDRGYGYVYLHSEEFFNVTSDHLSSVITGIGAKKNGIPVQRRLRGLQTQDDGVTTTKYECDDTLFECQPVCMKSKGLTRSKVSDGQCSGVKPTTCCRCYYDAHWACENDVVVCKATMAGGEAQTVGDLVCITRGTPKPTWDLTAQTRTAGQCDPLEVEQTRRPTEQCLADAAAKPEEPAVEEVEEATESPAATVAPVVGSLPEMDLMGSAVHVAVGAALLALA